MDTSVPCVSFIAIVDFSQAARWIFMTDSVTDLLGFTPDELLGQPSLDLVHPDEAERVRHLHYDTIKQDKAAAVVYLRLRHKSRYKGYILCAISRTVAHDILVGSVSFARPGAKAFHNASTAQEITVITPSASNFELRRWNDPLTTHAGPESRFISPASSSSSSSSEGGSDTRSSADSNLLASFTFDPLPCQSYRTAFLLNRFTLKNTILYCSNDLLLSSTTAMGRSFFDFVAEKDEADVRSWIDLIKSWGVNEGGQPSDGGFGFGRFALLPEGRVSITELPEQPRRSRFRQGSTLRIRTRLMSTVSPMPPVPIRPQATTVQPLPRPAGSVVAVDAIFSAHSDGLMVILRPAVF